MPRGEGKVCGHTEGPCECGPEGFGLRDDDPRVNAPVSPSDAVRTLAVEEAYRRQSERVRGRIAGEYGPYTNQDWADVNILYKSLIAVEARTLARVRGRIEKVKRQYAGCEPMCNSRDTGAGSQHCDCPSGEIRDALDELSRSLSASEDTTQGET
jgi:hypothetical protein